MADGECPGPAAIVNILPVPQNVTHGWIPGRNVSRPMRACCAPNPVQVSEGCYEWCELPTRLTSKTSDEEELRMELYRCLEENHRDLNVSKTVAVHVPEDESESGAGRVEGWRVTFSMLVVWGLVASAFVVLG